MADHYLTLGVTRNASEREIARAYRRLARRYHPDVSDTPEATVELFFAVQEAYETLSDPRRRAGHDAELARRFGAPHPWRPREQTGAPVATAARPAAATSVATGGPTLAPLKAQTATTALELVAVSALLLPAALVLADTLAVGYSAYLWAAAGSLLALAGSSFARSLSLRELDRLWRWSAAGGRARLARSKQAVEARHRIELADGVTLLGRRVILATIPILFLVVHR